MSSIFTMNFVEDRANESFLVKTFYPSPLDGTTEYEILNLDNAIKSDTIDEMKDYHWARSAILIANSVDEPLDNSDYKVLAVAPPTAIRLDTFQSRVPFTDVFANEHVEGTMVNVFYDARNNHWEMATKHAVGGKYWFYRTDYGALGGVENKTFRKMFVEAFGMDCENEDLWLEELLPFLNQFSKDYSYSFVLQHPDNHIVYYIQEPRVYLVAIYHIGDTVMRVHPDEYELGLPNQWRVLNSLPVYFPARFDASRGYGLLEQYVPAYMGVMLCVLETGERAVIRNEYYLGLKQIRGNHPNLQFHFFEMLQKGTLATFQTYFPFATYTVLFHNFWADYMRNIYQVHAYYVKKFITKTMTDGIPKKYFVHIMRLHELYKTTRQKITVDVVNQYFMQMTPGQILFYMDYDNKRQQQQSEQSFTDELAEKKTDVWNPENTNVECWGTADANEVN